MLLHVGFETPTPEIMQKWGSWFQASAGCTVENVGSRNGREISKTGVRDLEMGPDALTGYTIINAENLNEAEEIARSNPFTSGIRVYELVMH